MEVDPLLRPFEMSTGGPADAIGVTFDAGPGRVKGCVVCALLCTPMPLGSGTLRGIRGRVLEEGATSAIAGAGAGVRLGAIGL